jgi:hypothetical protein
MFQATKCRRFDRALGRAVMLTIGHAPRRDGSLKVDQFPARAGPRSTGGIARAEITMRKAFKKLRRFLKKVKDDG